MKFEWKKIREQARTNETQHVKETLWTNRIIKIIVLGLIGLLLVCGIGGYLYVNHALGPVESNNQNKISVMDATILERAAMLSPWLPVVMSTVCSGV